MTKSIVSMSALAVTISLVISKQEGGKRVEIGQVACYVPTLKAFGLDVEPKADDAGNAVLDSDGLPVYEAQENAYLFAAVVNWAKASARSKTLPGTSDVRPGQTLPTTLAELSTPAVRSGSAVLAERHALIALWVSFVDALPNQPAVKALAKQFMKAPDTLLAQPEKVKTAMSGWVEAFAAEHAEKLTDYQMSHLEGVIATAEEDAASLEW